MATRLRDHSGAIFVTCFEGLGGRVVWTLISMPFSAPLRSPNRHFVSGQGRSEGGGSVHRDCSKCLRRCAVGHELISIQVMGDVILAVIGLAEPPSRLTQLRKRVKQVHTVRGVMELTGGRGRRGRGERMKKRGKPNVSARM